MDDAGIWNLQTIKNQQKLNEIVLFSKKEEKVCMYMQFSLHCYYDASLFRSYLLLG